MTTLADMVTQMEHHLATAQGDVREDFSYYNSEHRLQAIGVSVPPEMRNLIAQVGWPRIYVDAIEERLDVEGFGWPVSPMRTTGFGPGGRRTTLTLSRVLRTPRRWCTAGPTSRCRLRRTRTGARLSGLSPRSTCGWTSTRTRGKFPVRCGCTAPLTRRTTTARRSSCRTRR